jgi:hypothetical protein
LLKSKVDEDSVLNFFASKELEPKRYSSAEMKTYGKTPDFQVYKDGQLSFFCEVKSLFDSDTEGPKHDPSYNKIVNKIHEAIAQLLSVNPDREYPNVLAFVDHELGTDSADLGSFLDGYYYSDDGEKHHIKNYFDEKKYFIDLFIWFEDEPRLFFVTPSPFKDHLCSIFGVDSKEIIVRDFI